MTDNVRLETNRFFLLQGNSILYVTDVDESLQGAFL